MMYTTTIVTGHGRGKLLGFPTFNLIIPADLHIKHGIYAARVTINGHSYMGAMHFGPVPVFDQDVPTLEIFLLDYEDKDTVSELRIEVLQYLREIKNFSTEQALQEQITQDVEKVRGIFATIQL